MSLSWPGGSADSTRSFVAVSVGEPISMPSGQDDRSESGSASALGRGTRPRLYIGILFECCGVYVRVYRRPKQKFYYGRCPKCLRGVRVRVGPGGTNARLFRAK